MTNRRTFLGRSVLGAGSVLFLPGLLGSCTDHRIPDPNTSIILPPIGDYAIDWNDTAKIVVKSGLEMIPEAGEILGPLVEIFWPKTDKPVDVWGEVRAQVEAIVNQKIAEAVYTDVSNDLEGLRNSTLFYLQELNNYNDSVTAYQKDPTQPVPNPSDLKTQWFATRNSFATALPQFQSPGNELPLLGLFAQFANMYLSLLRDGVLKGQEWGRSAGDHQDDIKVLKEAISDFIDYARKTFISGATNLKTKKDDHNCEPFRTINMYSRQMTLTVLDFLDTWPYFDVTLYPNGAKNPDGTPINILNREIYSDPYGSCDNSGDIITATPVPTQLPTQLTVWGHDRIDAVQLTYPDGSGPKGVTTTPRMGDQSGGTTQDPFGGIFNLLPDNPITMIRVLYDVYQVNTTQLVGPVVTGMQFKFNNGTATNVLSNTNLNSVVEKYDTGLFGYTDNALSSIHINGVNNKIGSADCVVFGFQYWQSPTATLRAIGNIYIHSPKEHSAADFAKAFPKLSIGANLITEEYKAARRAYWAYIEAYVKGHK